MSDIRVGSWNARDALGDRTLDRSRLDAALEIIWDMDADVVAIPETAHRRHKPRHLNDRLSEIRARMAAEGYIGAVTDYAGVTSERNHHLLSIWTRVGGIDPEDPETGAVQIYGSRHGLRVTLPETRLIIDGLHLDDQSEDERVTSAQALLHHSASGIDRVIMGDLNAMHARDHRSTLPRALGHLISKFEVEEYYNPKRKLQRAVGRAIRACRMAKGNTLATLEAGGFHDADPNMQPTIGQRRIAYQLDHILGSKNVVFENFKIHPRRVRSTVVSDHSPISAVVKR